MDPALLVALATPAAALLTAAVARTQLGSGLPDSRWVTPPADDPEDDE